MKNMFRTEAVNNELLLSSIISFKASSNIQKVAHGDDNTPHTSRCPDFYSMKFM